MMFANISANRRTSMAAIDLQAKALIKLLLRARDRSIEDFHSTNNEECFNHVFFAISQYCH